MDFVMTIESDDESQPWSKDNKKPQEDAAHLNAEFQFDVTGDPYTDLMELSVQQDIVKKVSKPVSTTSLLCVIVVHRVAQGSSLSG